ncbi:MAG: HAD family hydrolase [Candidatus Bathyarchaeota archaeon]|nr:HAD family hydrolase [Candidatus Bathyarchaeota archaeon]
MTVLCFDLDGTLCDLWMGERIAKFTLLDEIAKYTDETRDMVSRTYDVTWAVVKYHYMEMVNDGLSEHKIRSLHMGMVFEEYWIDEDPDRFATLHGETTMKNMEIYPDAEQVITKLAEKYLLCMITNGATDNQQNKIKRLPFRDMFKETIISQELGHHKPSKVIFDTMAERMNTAPSEMVYIGNDYQKDIIGAKNSGWKTVWIDRKDEERDRSVPDWTIKELSELLEIF